MKLNPFILAIALVANVGAASAQSMTFTVGKGNQTQQIAQVESVTDFETFTGRTDKVSGSFVFDPTKKTGSGSISIDMGSVDTGIALRNDHMRSPMWLDTEKFKTATFKATKVQFVKGDTYKVTGQFTMHGVTKTVVTNINVKYIKASAATKNAGFKGNVAQVKTSFKVKLSDFGVKIPDMAKPKVSDSVTISVTVYGQTG